MAATVVNLLPKMLVEKKIGLVPPIFEIPARSGDFSTGIPGVLVVDNVTASTYIDSDRGSLVIKKMPEEIANALVEDFIRTQVFWNENAKPGLFWVDGKHTGEQIIKNFSEELNQARGNQLAWYKSLVESAQNEYAKYKSARAIYEFQRIAARELGMQVDWLTIERADATVKCPACQTFISEKAVVCPNCKTVIKAEEYKKFQVAVK